MKYIRLHNKLNEDFFNSFEDEEKELDSKRNIDDILDKYHEEQIVTEIFPKILAERSLFSNLHLSDYVQNSKTGIWEFIRNYLHDSLHDSGDVAYTSLKGNDKEIEDFCNRFKDTNLYEIVKNFAKYVKEYSSEFSSHLKFYSILSNKNSNSLTVKTKQILYKTNLGKCNKMLYGIYNVLITNLTSRFTNQIQDVYIGQQPGTNNDPTNPKIKYYKELTNISSIKDESKSLLNDVTLFNSPRDESSLNDYMQKAIDTFYVLLISGINKFKDIINHNKTKTEKDISVTSMYDQTNLKSAIIFYYVFYYDTIKHLEDIANNLNIDISSKLNTCISLNDYVKLIIDSDNPNNSVTSIQSNIEKTKETKKYISEYIKAFGKNIDDALSSFSKNYNLQLKTLYNKKYEVNIERDFVQIFNSGLGSSTKKGIEVKNFSIKGNFFNDILRKYLIDLERKSSLFNNIKSKLLSSEEINVNSVIYEFINNEYNYDEFVDKFIKQYYGKTNLYSYISYKFDTKKDETTFLKFQKDLKETAKLVKNYFPKE